MFLCVVAAAAAQALHLANQPPQQQMYSALAPTPPSMTPGPNPQSPQASFPSAQQTVYIHPQQVQHGYNHNHMAHVQQVGHTTPSAHRRGSSLVIRLAVIPVRGFKCGSEEIWDQFQQVFNFMNGSCLGVDNAVSAVDVFWQSEFRLGKLSLVLLVGGGTRKNKPFH